MSVFTEIKNKILGKTQEPDSIAELPQFIPTPLTDLPQFSEADIQFRERNHQVESKQDMINYIDESDLSFECKQCFKNILVNVYDRNIILADHSETNGKEIAYLEAQLDFFPQLLVSATKNDRLKPAYLEIKNMINLQLRSRLSRTSGKDRERIIITKNQISNEMTMNRISPEVKK